MKYYALNSSGTIFKISKNIRLGLTAESPFQLNSRIFSSTSGERDSLIDQNYLLHRVVEQKKDKRFFLKKTKTKFSQSVII